MAIFYCGNCSSFVDTDHNIMEEGPYGTLWCEECIIEYHLDQDLLAKYRDEFDPGEAQEWFDYDPEC